MLSSKISAFIRAGLVAVVLLLAGCGGGQQNAAAPAAPGKETPPKEKGKSIAPATSSPEAEAAALEESIPEWKYDPSNKWDPFIKPEPPVETGPEGERYDLDQMLLLGVVHGSDPMSAAYIRLPNGKDRIVKIGDILGKHGGEVKEIGKDYIVVEEKYMDPQHPNDTFIIEKELKIAKDKKK